MSLTITTDQTPEQATIQVEGEVDVSCADDLREELNIALDASPVCVEVDLSAMPYIDSTGIGVLVGFAHRAADEGVSFSLVAPQPNVLRVLMLLGVDKDLNVVPASAEVTVAQDSKDEEVD